MSQQPPNNGANNKMEAQSAIFLEGLHAITGIKLMCQLTKAVQQHRGASVGFLSGEQDFFPLANAQEQLVDKLFLALRLHGNFSTVTFPPIDFSSCQSDWEMIKRNWQSDELLHNFEFHSHLIERCHKIIRAVANEKLLDEITEADVVYKALLNSLLVQLPNIAESLAILRGLSTNATVVMACGKDSHSRLSFLIKEIPVLLRELENSLYQLAAHYPQAEQLKPSKGLLRKLKALLKKIDSKILANRKIQEDSQQLFRLTTEVIDDFWKTLDLGLYMLEQDLHQQFLTIE